jgi:hypothetical protein
LDLTRVPGRHGRPWVRAVACYAGFARLGRPLDEGWRVGDREHALRVVELDPHEGARRVAELRDQWNEEELDRAPVG